MNLVGTLQADDVDAALARLGHYFVALSEGWSVESPFDTPTEIHVVAADG